MVEGLAPGAVYYFALASGGEVCDSGESLFKVVMPEPDGSNRPMGVMVTETDEDYFVVVWETARPHRPGGLWGRSGRPDRAGLRCARPGHPRHESSGSW